MGKRILHMGISEIKTISQYLQWLTTNKLVNNNESDFHACQYCKELSIKLSSFNTLTAAMLKLGQ